MGLAASRVAATLSGSTSAGGAGSGSGVLSGGTDVVTITGAVAQGELVTLHEGGYLRRTNPLVPVAVSNNNTPGPVPITQTLSTAGSPGKLSGAARRADLNFAVLLGNAVEIRSPSGALMQTFTFAQGGSTSVQGCLLANGGFATIAATLGSNAGTPNLTLVAQLYNADGTTNGSSITLLSNYAGTGGTYNAAASIMALTNGGCAASWTYVNSDGSVTTSGVQAISAAGATVGAPLSFSTGITLAPAANGDYLLVYQAANANSNQCVYLSRYSGSAGTKTWGPSALGSAGQTVALPGATFRSTFRELASGNIVLMTTGPETDGYNSLFVYSSAGALVREVHLTAAHGAGSVAAVAATPLGFGLHVYSAASTQMTLTQFDGNGVALLGPVAYGAAFAQAPTAVLATWTGCGFAVVPQVFQASNNTIQLLVVDGAGVLQGSAAMLSTSPQSGGAYFIAGGEDGIVIVGFSVTSASVANLATFKVARSAIEGAAQAPAADGATVTIASEGYFPLPASQRFLAGGTFDTRQNVVPGTAGTIGTSGAWLKGWRAGT